MTSLRDRSDRRDDLHRPVPARDGLEHQPANSLTVQNTSSSPYTLKVMTIVDDLFLPLVLLYQGWTYYVFRRRVTTGRPRRLKRCASSIPGCSAGPGAHGSRLAVDVVLGAPRRRSRSSSRPSCSRESWWMRSEASSPSVGTIAALAAIMLGRGVLVGGFETVGRLAAVAGHVRAPTHAGGATPQRDTASPRTVRRRPRWPRRPSRASTRSRPISLATSRRSRSPDWSRSSCSDGPRRST